MVKSSIVTNRGGNGLWITCRLCKANIHMDELTEHECVSANIVSPASLSITEKATKHIEIFFENDKIKENNKDKKVSYQRPAQITPVVISPRKTVCVDLDTVFSQVRDFHVTKDGYAVYQISTKSAAGKEYLVERRFSEFYEFARQVDQIHPPSRILKQLPPKTYCGRNNRNSFLETRRQGLESFLSDSMQILLDLNNFYGPSCKRSAGILYRLNQFLRIPSNFQIRNALGELKRHALQSTSWNPLYIYENDETYEKEIDGFMTIKRTCKMEYSAKTVFDILLFSPEDPISQQTNSSLIEGKLLSKISDFASIEHLRIKSYWPIQNREMVNYKCWREDPDGTMLVVNLPADESEWPNLTQEYERADAVLFGWVIRPLPNQDACMVTWLMQADFHGSIHGNSRLCRSFLIYLSQHVKDINNYLNAKFIQIPKLFHQKVMEKEKEMVFMIQTNVNDNNVVIFKPKLRSMEKLHALHPLSCHWIDTKDEGHITRKLSPIERKKTFQYRHQVLDNKTVEIVLDLIPTHIIQLHFDGDSKWRCYIKIDSKKQSILLRSLFIQYQEKNISSTIGAVHIIGEDENGKLKTDQYYPKHYQKTLFLS